MTRIIFCLLFGFAIAFGSAAAARTPLVLADDAPDSYTVSTGDTLWSIAGRFLREPWRWPEIWRMNRSQIANPHLIHPGQVILLDRSGPSLQLARKLGDGSVRLQPRIHEEALVDAIPAIPLQAIEPFLSRPRIVDDGSLAGAATIIATETSRMLTATGDTVFATAVSADVDAWQIFRPARPLRDPASGEIIAYEADYLGSARVRAHGEPAELEISAAIEEIGVGDRMLPSEHASLFAYAPHAPDHAVSGRIVSIHRGVAEAGPLSVVTLGVGTGDGIERGHVLALLRTRGRSEYRDEQGIRREFELPDQPYGLALVFRVYQRLAHALVMESDGQVSVGDAVRTP